MNTSLTPITEYKKSNLLITSKSKKSSMLELKIMAICFLNISNGQYHENKSEDIICTLRAADIKKMIGNTSGSVYNRLSEIATSMTTNVIRILDPQEKKFVFIPLFSKVEYVEKEGKFMIAFNHYLKEYLIDYSMNFTILGIETMLNFRSMFSYRLYEHLKARAFHPKRSKDKSNDYQITFNISELKFDLGVYDAADPAVKKLLEKDKPDWDEAIEVLKQKAQKKSSYDSYGEFKRSVLQKAVDEINNSTDLDIYKIDSKVSGKGGKVNSVVFHVRYKKGSQEDISLQPPQAYYAASSVLSDNEVLDFIDEVYNKLSVYGLKLRDCKMIAETSGYDMPKIDKAIKVIEDYPEDIANLAGFLKTAIEKDFEPCVAKKAKRSNISNKLNKKNSFKNFEESGTDYNAMVENLIQIQTPL